MHQLFGDEYADVLSFNYDTGRWNKRKYHGCKITDQFLDTNNAKLVKADFDSCSSETGYELAGLAVRNNGLALFGAMILRDLKSGKISDKTAWVFFGRNLLNKQVMADCIASTFMCRFLYEDAFKKSVLSVLNKSR